MSPAAKSTDPAAAARQILQRLQSLDSPANVAGMARFGISGRRVLGVSVAPLRQMAREAGRRQELAEALRRSGIFEARLLAGFVAEPGRFTPALASAWIKEVECWADCDGLCIHLFRKLPFAHELAVKWSARRAELVKRAGFTLMATLAVHDRACPDRVFQNYLDRVESGAGDGRHNVKKGVNWALRQIGKRNSFLNLRAIETAERIRRVDTPAARWIAADALRELKRWQTRNRRITPLPPVRRSAWTGSGSAAAPPPPAAENASS